MFALMRLGDTERAGQALADLDERAQERGDVRVATAALRSPKTTRARRPSRSPRS